MSLSTHDYALLAADTYMRTLVPTLSFVPPNGAEHLETLSLPTGFLANAYKIDGKIIIAYAGTNEFSYDPVTGWPVAWGNLDSAAQVTDAISFYKFIRTEYPSFEICVTGHSLGGALAGVVGSLYGLDGHLFDYQPFGATVQAIQNAVNATSPTPTQAEWISLIYGSGPITIPNDGGLGRTHVEGELAGWLRSFWGGASPNELSLHGADIDLIDAHSIHLLALLQWAAEGNVADPDWQEAAHYVLPELFDPTVGDVVGIPKELKQYAGYDSALATKLLISYSGEGGPAGNSAIRAYFDDMTDLGKSEGLGFQKALAFATTMFAGKLGYYKVEDDRQDGTLTLDPGQNLLHLDLSGDRWDFANSEGARLAKYWVANYLLEELQITYDLRQVADQLRYVDNYVFSTATGGFTGTIPDYEGSYTAFVGTNSADNITGSEAADIIFGGRNNAANAGDAIDGAEGGDFIVGSNEDDFLSGGDDDDMVIGGNGYDTISGGSGNDVIYSGRTTLQNTDETSYSNLAWGDDGFDVMFGSGGSDTFDGGNDDDYLDGGFGDDHLDGGNGRDILVGGAGNDTFYTSGADGDLVIGGGDNDTLNVEAGGRPTVIISGSGSDVIKITSEQHVNVSIVYIPGIEDVDADNINMDAILEQLLPHDSNGDVIIVNPSAGDKLYFNGQLITGASYGPFEQYEDTFTFSSGLYPAGDYFPELGWTHEGLPLYATIHWTEVTYGGTMNGLKQGDIWYEGQTLYDRASVFIRDASQDPEGGPTMSIDGFTQGILGISISGNGPSSTSTEIGTIWNVTSWAEGHYVLDDSGQYYKYIGDEPSGGVMSQMIDESSTSEDLVVDPEFYQKDGTIELALEDVLYAPDQPADGLPEYIPGWFPPSDGDDVRVTGTSEDDYISTGEGDDELYGGAGNDYLEGGDGSDTYVAAEGKGTDQISDSSGNDSLIILGETAAPEVELSAHGYTIRASIGDGSSSVEIEGQLRNTADQGVERIIVAGGGDAWTKEQIFAMFQTTAAVNTGTVDSDTFIGSDIAQVFDGDDGDDFFDGGGGADSFSGGDGFDTVAYGNSAEGLTVDAATGTLNTGHALGNTFSSIERVELSDFDDVAIMGGGVVEVDGGRGNDTITGSDGNDTIFGGAGDDTVVGGGGDDQLSGDGGEELGDKLVYSGVRADFDLSVSTYGNGFIYAFNGITDNNALDGDEGSDTVQYFDTVSFSDIDLRLRDPAQLFDAEDNLIGTFGTIQAAIDSATEGQIVRVNSGVFSEALTIAKGISLFGTGDTTINGGMTGAAITVGAGLPSSAITLAGLRLASESSAVVSVQSTAVAASLSIINSGFDGGRHHGLFVDGAAGIGAMTLQGLYFADYAQVADGADEGAIFFNQYAGDLSLIDIVIDAPGAAAQTGIKLSGGGAAMGTVLMNSVNVYGAFEDAGMTIADFAHLDNLEIQNAGVRGYVSAGVAGVNVENVGGTLDLSEMSIDVTNTAPGPAYQVRVSGLLSGGIEEFLTGDDDDALFGEGGDDILSSGLGNDLISGMAGQDSLEGGLGDDLLFGGTDDDIFLFRGNDGIDTIADFETHGGAPSGDRIRLLNVEEEDFEDLLGGLVEADGNTTINLTGGGSITLSDVTISELSQSDFLFG